MKGKVLDYNIQNDSGLISGDDGNRYEFSSTQWKSSDAPKPYQKVDFEIDENIAKGIYLESPSPSYAINPEIADVSPICWYFRVLKKYFVFKGRATRSEYWYYTLFNTIAIILFTILDNLLNADGILSLIYLLAVLIPGIAVLIRRLHDIGRTGWWWLLSFLPIIGGVVLLIFTLLDSTEDNKYGVNPKIIKK